MFILTIRDSFSAAHRLEMPQTQCEELHGHNFVVEASFKGEVLERDGTLVDFSILRGHLEQVLKGLDHHYLNEIPFFAERASSSEYIAMYVYNGLKQKVTGEGVGIEEVKVWESDTSAAAYREKG